MSVRLRRAPPRRRRAATRASQVVGVAVFALAFAIGFSAIRDRDRGPQFTIVALPDVPVRAAASVSHELDGVLFSMPPVAPPRPMLDDKLIISYYGNPLAAVLGVLGEDEPEKTIARLRAQADAYREHSGGRTVTPAIHLIYAVAQHYPGPDGTYLLRMDDAMVEKWIRLARDNGMLLILDIQMGRSTVEAELPHLFPFLVHEHVHVALDPEFAWGKAGIPGDDIGHMDAAQINRAQAMIQQFAIDQRLPTKVLVVHQFLPGMVKQKAQIREYDRVELVIDADGYGPRHIKLGAWDRVVRDGATPRAAIKLFYRHDTDIMQPADVMSLDPSPVMVIYQ